MKPKNDEQEFKAASLSHYLALPITFALGGILSYAIEIIVALWKYSDTAETEYFLLGTLPIVILLSGGLSIVLMFFFGKSFNYSFSKSRLLSFVVIAIGSALFFSTMI